MWFKITILLSVIFQVCFSFTVDDPIVQTPNGKIQGLLKTSSEVNYLQFRGIPYAQPPIGSLRFAPPQPITPWSGTWIANTSYICLHVDHVDEPQEGQTKGSEDCLYVNIFVPGSNITPDGNLDVIVNIHGGCFMFSMYEEVYASPKPLMTKNVIVVSIKYRLGIFGFMSLEDKHLSGNLGMKDQVLALKWVRDNIKYFGGNPDSVTITGLSAGGAAVQFHTLSPMSRKLFHKAISTSGNVLDPWVLQEAAREKALKVGRAVGCGYENSEQFLWCLRSRSADQLVETIKLFREWTYYPFSPMSLVVDRMAEEPFLPEHPYKMLKDQKIADVPWMASLTTAEGLFPVAQMAARKEYFDIFSTNFEKYLPLLLDYEYTAPGNNLKEITRKIKEEYFKGKQVSQETYPEIIQMASDRIFNFGMDQAIRLHAKAIKSPVYFYSYDYVPETIWTFSELWMGYKEKYGVAHGDDVILIFDTPMKPSTRDAAIREFMLNVWVDFAKTGKPSPNYWKPVSKKVGDEGDISYLYIGNPDEIEMKKSNDLGNRKFWSGLGLLESKNLIAKSGKSEL